MENDTTELHARIQQLERERDDLHKDIEQLCMQQAGPGYLGVANRVHLHRIAALEQEVENLKNKFGACTRENHNLQEELSEAYRIKSQLADLHSAEVSKNVEAEKQLKFFQGCVASAFAERDNAVMEAEKAKEKEESNSREFYKLQERVDQLTSQLLEEKILTATLQSDLEKQSSQIEAFGEVVNKFYDIRQNALEDFKDTTWEDKCECLLRDSSEMWSFSADGDTSTSTYISSLEEEVETLRRSLDNLQNKLLVGLEIENHLKKRVRDLEKQNIISEEKIVAGISTLRDFHSHLRTFVTNLLDEGFSQLRSDLQAVEEKLSQLDTNRGNDLISLPQADDVKESECRDVHINTESNAETDTKRSDLNLSTTTAMGTNDASEVLALALREKVAALLLLSQEEERHLLERNMNAALHRKIEELQRNLLQVTTEKVKALMELAQLKQEYQLLLQKDDNDIKEGKSHSEIVGKKTTHDEGRLKNLLKKTYLRRFVGTPELEGNNAESYLSSEVNSIGFARMKIENATLRESLESMEHLTASIRRLRHSLLKVKECADTRTNNSPDSLENIIYEAKLLKTALGISLPVSWSAESETGHSSSTNETNDDSAPATRENVDFVSAAGFEMVELLVFVAQLLKENTLRSETR